MSDTWKRIAGIHLQEDGTLGCVWLGHDTIDDTIHVMDCCIFRAEVPIVIAEGINARGRWIPVAWPDSAKDMSEMLLNRGCRMLYDPVKESKALAEVTNRELWERMRTKRFKTNPRMAEWNDEFKGFKESEGLSEAYPLISATKHALSQLQFARRQALPAKKQTLHQRSAII